MKLLRNNSNISQFYEELQGEISYENVIQPIKSKQELNITFDEEIIFLSSNFHDFYTKYPELIFTLDLDIIELIIMKKNYLILFLN